MLSWSGLWKSPSFQPRPVVSVWLSDYLWDVQSLAKDLRQLLALVNDDVLHHHVNALLAALELPPGIPGKSVAAVIGGLDPSTPNLAVNTDARRRGFARAGVAGYLTR